MKQCNRCSAKRNLKKVVAYGDPVSYSFLPQNTFKKTLLGPKLGMASKPIH